MADSAESPASKAQVSLRQVEAFQRAVEDHRFLSEYVANVQASAALFNEPRPQKRIEAMRAFLAVHVTRHFVIEEKQVFQPLLDRERAPATRRAVADLVEEHREMRASVRKLRRKIRDVQASGSEQSRARLEQSFRDFLGVLQAHAIKEDNFLLAVKQSRRHATPLG